MARESIEALLNPSLKVSRPVAACARCRSAKIKCDGKLPACSACERAGKGHDCSSANDEFARGKERSYVAALETVVQRLERKINDARMENMSRRQSIAMLTDSRPSLQPKPMSLTRRKEASSVDGLVSDFGFLTVNATSRDFHGFSDTMSFAKLLQAIAIKDVLPVTGQTSLPPRSAISHLVDHYFEHLHVLLPFFSETEFLSAISRVYQEQLDVNVSPFDMWCVRLVLAIASASLCQARGDNHYQAALCHMSEAMKLADYVIYPGSISGIQALLLLVQYSLVDPEYFDSWYIVGMASRLLVDLGLHCEPAPETRMSKGALDLRRRIFYCTYALDRLVSMSLGLAFSFTDDSAPNVLLPTLATDQEARSPSQLFLRSVRPSLYLFDIRRVQSAFYQRTRWSSRNEWTADAAFEFISSTLDDVQAWYASLPDNFTHKHLAAFHLESLYTQLLALSPNQVIPTSIISQSHKLMFFRCAVQFATHLRTMTETENLRSSLCYADFCRARYVSRQFQNVMWANFDLMLTGDPANQSPIPQLSPLENCNDALLFLSSMSQILEWPKQRWGISALQEIYQQESAVLLARLNTRQQEYSMDQPPRVLSDVQTNFQPQNASPTGPTSPFQSLSPTNPMIHAQQLSQSPQQGVQSQTLNSAMQNPYAQQISPSAVQIPLPQSGFPSAAETLSSPGMNNLMNQSQMAYQNQIVVSPTDDAQYPSQLTMSEPQGQPYRPNFQSYSFDDYRPEASNGNLSAPHASLLRATSWSPNAEESRTLPQGSLPRRSYEFHGGQA